MSGGVRPVMQRWFNIKNIYESYSLHYLAKRKKSMWLFSFNNSKNLKILTIKKPARLKKKENLYSHFPSSKILFPVLLHNKNDVCHLQIGSQMIFCCFAQNSLYKMAFIGVKFHLIVVP